MRHAIATLLLASLVACGVDPSITAEIMCEQFIENRLGVEVEFDSEATIEPGSLESSWLVQSRADDGEGVFTYACEVRSVNDDEWALTHLTMDR